jgi:hypothetical protein
MTIALAIGSGFIACGSARAATDIRTFDFENASVSITLGRGSLLLGGCRIVAAELRNTGAKPLDVVIGAVVIVKDGETVGTDGLNFYPTDPGGRSRIAHIDYDQLSDRKCEDIQIMYHVDE